MLERQFNRSKYIFTSFQEGLFSIKKELKGKLAIFVDIHVHANFEEEIQAFFQTNDFDFQLFIIPAGEDCKTRKVKEKLEDQLFNAGYDNDSTFIAFGGGASCDLVGFLAASYLRGVKLIFVPTTLLAMVDAAVGGKNGVNLGQVKNIIGTIYHPSQVIIDDRFLRPLPKKQLISGLMEVIKIALVMDRNFFDQIELNVEKILSLDSHWLEKVIERAITLKFSAIDHQRDILNFGHTLGHALESASNWNIPHGICIAKGICFAMELSIHYGLAFDELHRVYKLFEKLDIDLRIDLPFSRLYSLMQKDKKALLQKPRFILIDKIGRLVKQGQEVKIDLEQEALQNAFLEFQNRVATCLQ